MASFTVLELMVAMLISSIVIGIVFYSYSFVNGQMNKRMLQSGKTHKYVLFDMTFARDMARASQIRDSAGSDHIIMSDGRHLIRYYINDSGIVRAGSGAIDTFFIPGGVESVQYVNDSLRLITGISLRISVGPQRVQGYYTKSYTAAELMAADEETHE